MRTLLTSTALYPLAMLGFVLTSTSAMAQQTAQGGTLEEITVTAQRRSENLQTVPIAITAITAQELDRRQITRTIDLITSIPNLEGHNNTSLGGANTYYLRGLGNTESISVIDPPVGTYIDEFYIARQSGNNFGFYDVDRIEVLRGPQGTLFGRNTTGGSINIFLKKPAETFGGYLEAGVGKYNAWTTRASVDVPIVEGKLLSKFSGYTIHDDGYVFNLTTKEHLNYQHTWAARGAIRALFSDKATWDFSVDHQYMNYMNLINFPNPNGKGRVDYTPILASKPVGPGLFSERLADNALFDKTDNTHVISNFGIELNDTHTFNAISGYHHMHFKNIGDGADGLNSAAPNVLLGILVNAVPGNSTPLPNDNYVDEFTQELKVSGKAFDSKLEYVGGFYFFMEQADTSFATDTITPAKVASVVADRTLLNRTEAYAGYFQGDWHLTDAFKATAGVRYTAEFKHILFQPNANPLPHQFLPFSTQDIINQGVPVNLVAKVWTPRFALNYQINPDLLAYASATKGFKSGGWNGRSNVAQQVVPFGPEYNWTYEVGIKADLLDKRLRINTNAFYGKTSQFQGAAATTDRVTNVVTFLTQNFGTMVDYGLEGEVTALLADNLQVTWNVGIQRAKYSFLNPATLAQQATCLATITTTKSQCNTGVVTPDGGIGIPVRTPHLNSNLNVSYSMPLGGGYELDPTVTWYYVSQNWVSGSNQPGSSQPAHSLIGAGITLRNRDQRWAITADCSNCSNKTYVASFLTFQYLNEPGRWSIRAKYDF